MMRSSDEEMPNDDEHPFFVAYLNKINASKCGDHIKEALFTRAMWEAAKDELDRGGIDSAVSDWLSNIIGAFLDGIQPDEFAILKTKQRDKRRNDGVLDCAIIIAATYRQAVSKGIITDPSPNKTIRNAYGLKDNATVLNWDKKFAGDKLWLKWSIWSRKFDKDKRAARLIRFVGIFGKQYSASTRLRNRREDASARIENA